MGEIFFFIGFFVLCTPLIVIGLIVIGFFSKAGRKNDSAIINMLLLVAVIGLVFIIIPGENPLHKGKPLTSIDEGAYTLVGKVEVSKDKQAYYQLILEQEGEVKLYTLPKDMIIIKKSNEKSDTLEVVKKAGLKKAVLYEKPKLKKQDF